MPSKKRTRQVNATQPALTAEIIAKRSKRHLDELERSNYAEPSISFLAEEDDDEGSGKYSKGRARNIISDKRAVGLKKKKSTMNVRTALLYRKNLTTLVDESGIGNLPAHLPTYLTAVTDPPSVPPRLICSVCGYWGRYKCRRCGMGYCGRACEGVHGETRCERRLA